MHRAIARSLLAAAGLALVGPSVASAQWSTVGNIAVYNSGPVAIGTSNPAGQFDVRSNGTRTISAFNNALTGYNYAVHGTSLSNNGRGVYGIAQNIAGNGAGVFGVSNGFIGRGVYGRATDNRGGASYGVEGKASSSGGAGVFGQNAVGVGVYGTTAGSNESSGLYGVATAASGFAYGVNGVSFSTEGRGLTGYASAGVGETYGVLARSDSTSGRGVYGLSLAATGSTRGVWGRVVSPTGHAGYFEGGMNYFEGSVGLGDSTPDAKLDIEGNVIIRDGDRFYFGDAGENGDSIYFTRTNFALESNNLYLVLGEETAGADAFIIQANGMDRIYFDSSGGASKPGGGAWAALSDRRAKKNIEPLAGALDRLMDLRGVAFEYKDLTTVGAAPGPQIGFIAQEVETVFPEWVNEVNGMKTVAVKGFEALTVEALRTLRTEKDDQIAALRAEKDTQIAARDAEIEELRDRLERVEAMMQELSQR